MKHDWRTLPRGRILVVALAALLTAGMASAQTVPASLQTAVARIDAMAAAEHAKDDVARLTVGVVHRGQLIWTRSYGHADAERKIPATKDTVYRVASITKQFTALMLLQLVEAGKVSLSDPVERYLPAVNRIGRRHPSAPPITLVQVATMTAGIAVEPDNLSKYLVGPVAEWETTLVAAIGETKYEHEPGTRYLYSNIGYAILGAALARAAGVSYTTYVEQRILASLGMTRTAFERIHRPSRTGVILLRNAAGGKFDQPGLSLRAMTELAEAGTPATSTP